LRNTAQQPPSQSNFSARASPSTSPASSPRSPGRGRCGQANPRDSPGRGSLSASPGSSPRSPARTKCASGPCGQANPRGSPGRASPSGSPNRSPRSSGGASSSQANPRGSLGRLSTSPSPRSARYSSQRGSPRASLDASPGRAGPGRAAEVAEMLSADPQVMASSGHVGNVLARVFGERLRHKSPEKLPKVTAKASRFGTEGGALGSAWRTDSNLPVGRGHPELLKNGAPADQDLVEAPEVEACRANYLCIAGELCFGAHA
jgi:hypothetical protein